MPHRPHRPSQAFYERGSATAWLIGALLLCASVAAWIAPKLHWGAQLKAAAYAYSSASPTACATASTVPDPTLPRYRVRAPSNYRADHAHALLIVLSPAGFGPGLTERYTGLTRDATARGLIVAYVGAKPMSRELPTLLARLPDEIARQWCIDSTRITYAGHSDGGTLAQVIALHAPRPAPRAVFASAAGLREDDFAALGCATRAKVLLLHGRHDAHFPGYGLSAARGWARCLRCTATPALDASGCHHWSGCAGSLRLCEHDGDHLAWPAQAREQLIELAAPSG